MTRPRTIAIDGPAGSGKSTICELIARRYGYIFVDTGAFYRAITYAVLKAGLPIEESPALADLLTSLQLRVESDDQSGYRVLANGEDITAELRTRQVESNVSAIAQMPLVRTELLPIQRDVAAGGHIILAGRDIGTVVLPDADLKLFLDASLPERARRRHLQEATSGKKSTQEAVQAALLERDRIDSERSLAPLVQAEDAIYILTDGKEIEGVVAEISAIIEAWKPA